MSKQKWAAALCLIWVFSSPWWIKAMDRTPNSMALLMALLALTWWGSHRWRQSGEQAGWLLRLTLWFTTLFVGFQMYAVATGHGDMLNLAIAVTEPNSKARHLALLASSAMVALLYCAALAYPLWAVFGPSQLVLTGLVFLFVRYVQVPHAVFDAPRSIGETLALAELGMCMGVMVLAVVGLQWRLGERPVSRLEG